MSLLLILLSLWPLAPPPTPPAPCQARLELRQEPGGLLSVTGHCRNLLPTAGRYRYELSLTRQGAGGRSQNTQRGEFEVAPQQEVALSQTRVNATAQDTYRIYLRVLDMSGRALAQDSVVQVPGR